MATRKPQAPLRRGWTTGACATAASKAAYQALLSGEFPDPVSIALPKGQQPVFALACEQLGADFALAGIIKDAGDDPDVTHGALVCARIQRASTGRGVCFKAGSGVGIVTKPGLPLAVGEPAINPVPRRLMVGVIKDLARQYGDCGDVEIELSIPDGERLAEKTWNPRLGILGGLSILGTTGVVIPYSCSAWIHSIHRGIDVARASGLSHIAGCTGSVSERAVQTHYRLSDQAMIDMGDFVGGMLKYLRRHPLPRLTIGGGFAKLCKLARGHLDLHSGRSQIDFDWLAEEIKTLAGSDAYRQQIQAANTAHEVLLLTQDAELALAEHIAQLAKQTALEALRRPVTLDVMVFDRAGKLVGCSGV